MIVRLRYNHLDFILSFLAIKPARFFDCDFEFLSSQKNHLTVIFFVCGRFCTVQIFIRNTGAGKSMYTSKGVSVSRE